MRDLDNIFVAVYSAWPYEMILILKEFRGFWLKVSSLVPDSDSFLGNVMRESSWQ